MNKYRYFTKRIKSVLAVTAFLLSSSIVFGQSFNIDFANSSDPADSDPGTAGNQEYIHATTPVSAKIINVAGFNTGDKFYFYYNRSNDPTDYSPDRLIGSPVSYPSGGWTSNEKTFTGTIA